MLPLCVVITGSGVGVLEGISRHRGKGAKYGTLMRIGSATSGLCSLTLQTPFRIISEGILVWRWPLTWVRGWVSWGWQPDAVVCHTITWTQRHRIISFRSSTPSPTWWKSRISSYFWQWTTRWSRIIGCQAGAQHDPLVINGQRWLPNGFLPFCHALLPNYTDYQGFELGEE